jgi:hypothetical protein
VEDPIAGRSQLHSNDKKLANNGQKNFIGARVSFDKNNAFLLCEKVGNAYPSIRIANCKLSTEAVFIIHTYCHLQATSDLTPPALNSINSNKTSIAT